MVRCPSLATLGEIITAGAGAGATAAGTTGGGTTAAGTTGACSAAAGCLKFRTETGRQTHRT